MSLGHLAIHFFEISQCQYDTETILANGKIGIGYWLADSNVGIKLLDIGYQELPFWG